MIKTIAVIYIASVALLFGMCCYSRNVDDKDRCCYLDLVLIFPCLTAYCHHWIDQAPLALLLPVCVLAPRCPSAHQVPLAQPAKAAAMLVALKYLSSTRAATQLWLRPLLVGSRLLLIKRPHQQQCPSLPKRVSMCVILIDVDDNYLNGNLLKLCIYFYCYLVMPSIKLDSFRLIKICINFTDFHFFTCYVQLNASALIALIRMSISANSPRPMLLPRPQSWVSLGLEVSLCARLSVDKTARRASTARPVSSMAWRSLSLLLGVEKHPPPHPPRPSLLWTAHVSTYYVNHAYDLSS